MSKQHEFGNLDKNTPLTAGHSCVLLFAGGEVREYCLFDSFEADCGNFSRVAVTSARIGRMRLGKCIDDDFNMGCSQDVMSYLRER